MRKDKTVTLLLIRHGITESNRKNVYTSSSEEDLTEEGRSQIGHLLLRLKNLNPASIYCSPLKRTHTTAQMLSQGHIRVNLREDLKEIAFGDFEGFSKEEIKQKWPTFGDQLKNDPAKIAFPNGESFSEVMQRAVKALEEIERSHQGEYVAIVTHEIIIKMMVIHTLQAPASIYHKFQIDCSSLSVIKAREGNRKLVSLNETSFR